MSRYKSLLIIRESGELRCFHLNEERGQCLKELDVLNEKIHEIARGSETIHAELKSYDLVARYTYREIHTVFRKFPPGRGLNIIDEEAKWLEIGSYFLGLHSGEK